MFKPLELFIGLRYIRAKRRNQFISFISFASMAGIALGVTVLITVMSVMNGFVTEFRERILGMASHVTVGANEGELKEWQNIANKVTELQPDIIGVAPYIRAEGMLTHGPEVSGTIIRGILPANEPEVSNVWEKMKIGQISDLHSGEYNIILGNGLARELGAGIGDKVTMVTPQAMSTPAGILPRLKRFTVVGIFEVGHNDFDTAMAFIHLDDAAKLFRYKDGVSGIRLKLKDLFQAPFVRQALFRDLPRLYWLSDWTLQYANFFRAVSLEKRMMFFILLLIILIAAFNLLASLVMAVTDKQADIAILRTLGVKPAVIGKIFVTQGAVIGFIGIIFGLIGGISLTLNVESTIAFIENLFGIEFMPADVYYISDFPTEIRASDILNTVGVAFSLSLLFSVIPAWIASRTQPAEALRYE